MAFKGKWVIITGGSKGIGKATAKEIVKLGGNVCIVARNIDTLKEAEEEIKKLKVEESQNVEIISCDTTDMEKLKPLFTDFIEKNGVPDYLFNFVGITFPDYVEKLSLDSLKKHMDINYYGQLIPILIVLPYFIENKKGYIANASSVAGYTGQMGYAAYTPTKFAITGLSEVLRHELKPYNIGVSVIFPSDTETPGLREELETRPQELNIMSESWGGLSTAEEIAKKYIKGVLKKKFNITPSFSSKFIRYFVRLFPRLVFKVADGDLKKARKKLGKDYKY